VLDRVLKRLSNDDHGPYIQLSGDDFHIDGYLNKIALIAIILEEASK
jgi:hypothetical protein